MKSQDEIRDAVIGSIKKVTSLDDVSIGDGELFDDHGLDSLDRMSVMIEVENRLDIDFDDADPATLSCINDYVKLVQSL